MKMNGVKKFLFSSSASIYGEPEYLPIDENHPIHALNPYGESKLIVEKILSDLSHSDNSWSIICLRYFNPIGSHHYGLIGDDPLFNASQLEKLLEGELSAYRDSVLLNSAAAIYISGATNDITGLATCIIYTSDDAD